MIYANDAMRRFGDPVKNERRIMTLYRVPDQLRGGAIPARIYCNRELPQLLTRAFGMIKQRGLAELVRTWDGCHAVRPVRGGSATSLHAWGLAVDLNAAANPLGQTPTMDPRLVACFEEAGFEWGGRWARPDGMHFQLAGFPE